MLFQSSQRKTWGLTIRGGHPECQGVGVLCIGEPLKAATPSQNLHGDTAVQQTGFQWIVERGTRLTHSRVFFCFNEI